MTLGHNLISTKASSEEELKKWNEEREKARKEWEESHPEEVAAQKDWLEKYKSKKPYTPTSKEKEIIKELLHMDDVGLSIMDIYIFNDGKLCVRTPQHTWTCMCGREWTVDLKERTSFLTCMN